MEDLLCIAFLTLVFLFFKNNTGTLEYTYYVQIAW